MKVQKENGRSWTSTGSGGGKGGLAGAPALARKCSSLVNI